MKIDILNINKNTKRTVLVGLVVILFFVSIVFFYYSMVYQEKKNRIVKSGELAANQSATQFDKYLSTNVDLINLRLIVGHHIQIAVHQDTLDIPLRITVIAAVITHCLTGHTVQRHTLLGE